MKQINKKLKNSKNSGFTLIELLVVIAIIGLLSSVVLASLSSARKKAVDAKITMELRQLRNALEMYYSDYGKYPIPDTQSGVEVIDGRAYCIGGTDCLLFNIPINFDLNEQELAFNFNPESKNKNLDNFATVFSYIPSISGVKVGGTQGFVYVVPDDPSFAPSTVFVLAGDNSVNAQTVGVWEKESKDTTDYFN